MTKVKLDTLEVRGTRVDVEVDDGGMFWAQVDGKRFGKDTLKALKADLIAALRKSEVKLDILFTRGDSRGRVLNGRVYGVHANGNPMIEWEDGSKGQDTGPRGENDFVPPLSPQETAEYTRLAVARQEAATAFANFVKDRTGRLSYLAEDALKAREGS